MRDSTRTFLTAVICTLLLCCTLLWITANIESVWQNEGERWRALERTKFMLEHQLKPELQKPSIEIPSEQDI